MGKKAQEKPLDVWLSLNDRQQRYLKAVYEADQDNEQARKISAARGNWNNTPADIWRWLLYATTASGHTFLKGLLVAQKLISEGTGSTFASLERRGLIETQGHDKGTTYEGRMAHTDRQWYIFVKITKLGRAVARAGDPSYAPAKKLPAGTLSEQQWAALVALYQAGEMGLEADAVGHYGGHSWRYALLRLRDYKRDGRNVPLMEESRRHEKRTRYFVVITERGKEYYTEKRSWYSDLYPNVKVP